VSEINPYTGEERTFDARAQARVMARQEEEGVARAALQGVWRACTGKHDRRLRHAVERLLAKMEWERGRG
jgi:hypothetical protein